MIRVSGWVTERQRENEWVWERERRGGGGEGGEGRGGGGGERERERESGKEHARGCVLFEFIKILFTDAHTDRGTYRKSNAERFQWPCKKNDWCHCLQLARGNDRPVRSNAPIETALRVPEVFWSTRMTAHWPFRRLYPSLSALSVCPAPSLSLSLSLSFSPSFPPSAYAFRMSAFPFLTN